MTAQDKLKGFSLLEVSISIFIASVGFLGITSLVLKEYQQAESFYRYTLASSELITLAEISSVDLNQYKKASTGFLKNLPQGRYFIEKNKIKVSWYDQDAQDHLSVDRLYGG